MEIVDNVIEMKAHNSSFSSSPAKFAADYRFEAMDFSNRIYFDTEEVASFFHQIIDSIEASEKDGALYSKEFISKFWRELADNIERGREESFTERHAELLAPKSKLV
ncbi:hypothetical protein CMI47_07455 [Candidatus Pacearchaeota archaeon]|nr:hypothetical protein [Candidatus Pacearchaeota archaeon]|tara:strand:+ start:2384 stop:2704 length:321 start_codon:yes stop_codon:yes gene_type:complete